MSPKQKRKARRDISNYKDPQTVELLREMPNLYKMPQLRESILARILKSPKRAKQCKQQANIKGINHQKAEEIAMATWL